MDLLQAGWSATSRIRAVDSNWPAPGKPAFCNSIGTWAGGDRRRDRGRKQASPVKELVLLGEGAGRRRRPRITLRVTDPSWRRVPRRDERGCGEPGPLRWVPDSVQLLGVAPPQPRVHVAVGEDRRTSKVPRLPSNIAVRPAWMPVVIGGRPQRTGRRRPCWPNAGWGRASSWKLNPIPAARVRAAAELIPGYVSDLYSAFLYNPMSGGPPRPFARCIWKNTGLRLVTLLRPSWGQPAQQVRRTDAPVIYRDPARTGK